MLRIKEDLVLSIWCAITVTVHSKILRRFYFGLWKPNFIAVDRKVQMFSQEALV
jgi:hypothetical protein